MKRSSRKVIQNPSGQFLSREFFQRDPVVCSREMIGCELLWRGCGGIIVETEAYSVRNDEACHTFSRPSSREFVATHLPGAAYIYLNYGVHWLLNFLVKGGREDGFVLVRALEPTRGIVRMQARRKAQAPAALCSGPGKLTQALGIDGSRHGWDFVRDGVLTLRRPEVSPRVEACSRIGISKATDLPWRFLAIDSAHVSVPAHAEKRPRRRG